MLFKNYIENAFSVIFKNRMRSFLTCLGVAIGVASMVLILSLTGGVSNILEGKTGGLYKGGLALMQGKNEGEVSLEMMEKVGKVKGIKTVVPIKYAYEKMSTDTTFVSAGIVGTNEDFLKIQRLKMKNGQFLEKGKTQDLAVVGVDLARKLFGTTDAVGRVIRVWERQFLVMGVLDEVIVSVLGDDLNINRAMIVPEKKMERKVLKGFLELEDNVSVEGVRREMAEKVPEVVFKTDKDLKDDAVSSDVNVAVLMLGVVSFVALFIGGIGVMNIMLVAAGERTREIGIRKAVGATGINILTQFLVESVILSVLGGILGVGMGILGVFLVGLFLRIEPFLGVDIIYVSFLLSVGVGMVFGVYPAFMAARKNVVSALKYYR